MLAPSRRGAAGFPEAILSAVISTGFNSFFVRQWYCPKVRDGIMFFFLLLFPGQGGVGNTGASFYYTPGHIKAGYPVKRGGGHLKRYRPDRNGPHRQQFEVNRKTILATQTICGICGKPVDKSLKSPHPMSATVDHIIPVSKGGHPSDITNLQLAHRCCNRAKSDKLASPITANDQNIPTNRNLKQSADWRTF